MQSAGRQPKAQGNFSLLAETPLKPYECHRGRSNSNFQHQTIPAIGASRLVAQGPHVAKPLGHRAVQQNSEWTEP
jgi:hypothetical protein